MITKEPLGDEWHDSKLYGTLEGVIDKTGEYSLEENRNCMNDIRVGKIGKERRLSKICISNIFKFLVETDD